MAKWGNGEMGRKGNGKSKNGEEGEMAKWKKKEVQYFLIRPFAFSPFRPYPLFLIPALGYNN